MHLLNQYILGLTYSESDIGFVLSAFGGFCLHEDWMKYTLAYSLHFCKLSPFIWGNTSKASGKITKATQLNRKKAWRPCRGYEFQLCKLGSLQRHIPGLCINISPFPGLLKKCKLCINVPNNSTILALQWLYWYTTNLHTYSDSDVTWHHNVLCYPNTDQHPSDTALICLWNPDLLYPPPYCSHYHSVRALVFVWS